MYSAVTHYLQAVKAAGTDNGTDVMTQMRKLPVDDMYARHAYLREDGRMVHDMFLVQVKAPVDSKEPWDFYKILKTVPGEEAFRPLSVSDCPYVKQ